MFFKKKKPKLDPKVRFQNRQWNQKLQQARTFKRNVVPVPDSGFSKLLKRWGMGSAWRQIGLALLVLVALYIVYFPNFLTLKTIQIEGIRDSDRPAIEASLRDNLAKVPFYNPQRNLLFLSQTRIESVLNTLGSVDTVSEINKDFSNNTLRIVITPTQERFMVRSNDKVFLVYNDGSLKGDTGPDRSAWENNLNSRLIKINIPANLLVGGNKQFLTQDTARYTTDLVSALRGIVGSSLAYLDIPISDEKKSTPEVTNDSSDELSPKDAPPEALASEEAGNPVTEENNLSSIIVEVQTPIALDELNIVMQKGNQPDRTFKVLVDPSENPKDLVDRLNLLLSQTAPDRYNALNYIDLRVKNRAYVCLLNAVCAN